jgi:DNA-binding NarL/FixJ family response regulator
MPGQPAVDVDDPRDCSISSGPYRTHEGPTYEQMEEGHARSCDSECWIRSKNRMISIGLIDSHSLTAQCIAKSLRDADSTLDVFASGSFETYLSNEKSYDIILYHAHFCARYQNCAEELPQMLKNLMPSPPIIILSDIDSPNLALNAFEAGARGFIPTTVTTIEMVAQIIRLVSVGGTFLPSSSMCRKKMSGEAEMFTSRELAVLDKLRLGKPNKIIAHELMLSQSTVKSHIRSIMRKMKVNNRTEIVSLWGFKFTHDFVDIPF